MKCFEMKKSTARTAVFLLALLATTGLMLTNVAHAQKPEWQTNLDWSAGNTEAGGACNCVPAYFSNAVPYCVAAGGRACVIATARTVAEEPDVI